MQRLPRSPTANTTISAGTIRMLRSEKRRVSLSTATSMMPVLRITMNMPPMMKVKNTTMLASRRPLGIASMKSTSPSGFESMRRKDSGSIVVRPDGPGTRSYLPAGTKCVSTAAMAVKKNRIT
jgi:hypothetical protein